MNKKYIFLLLGLIFSSLIHAANQGTTNFTGDLSVGTNKFTVAAATGDTIITGHTTISGLFDTNRARVMQQLEVANGATVQGGLSSTGNFAVNTNKFNVTAATGNTTVAGTLNVAGRTALNGGLALDTNKFVVDDGTGNTTIAGTLNAGAATVSSLKTPGDLTVNTNKFNVTGVSGNTAIAGSLSVSKGATIIGGLKVNADSVVIAPGTGNTTFTGTLAAGNTTINGTLNAGNTTVTGLLSSTGNFAVNTNKFSVAAASGNTRVAGTLNAGATTVSSLTTPGDVAVNTNKFNVTGASGNTTIAGTLNVSGATTLNGGLTMDSGKFAVADISGNTTVGGTLASTGNFSVNTNKFNVAAVSGNTTVAGTLNVTGQTNLNGTLKVSKIIDTSGVNVGGLYGISDDVVLSNDPESAYTPVLFVSMGDGSPIVITMNFIVDVNTNLKFDVILIDDKKGGYVAIVADESGMKNGAKLYPTSDPQIKAVYTPDSVDNPRIGTLSIALASLAITDPGTLIYLALGNISSITPIE